MEVDGISPINAIAQIRSLLQMYNHFYDLASSLLGLARNESVNRGEIQDGCKKTVNAESVDKANSGSSGILFPSTTARPIPNNWPEGMWLEQFGSIALR